VRVVVCVFIACPARFFDKALRISYFILQPKHIHPPHKVGVFLKFLLFFVHVLLWHVLNLFLGVGWGAQETLKNLEKKQAETAFIGAETSKSPPPSTAQPTQTQLQNETSSTVAVTMATQLQAQPPSLPLPGVPQESPTQVASATTERKSLVVPRKRL
jgi:hypothetical protein